MDMKIYYQKLRQAEELIAEPHAVVVSHETPEGGREGVRTEVPRSMAARLIVEGRARLATDEESGQFRADAAERHRVAQQAEAASRMQITVVSESDLRAIKSAIRGAKA